MDLNTIIDSLNEFIDIIQDNTSEWSDVNLLDRMINLNVEILEEIIGSPVAVFVNMAKYDEDEVREIAIEAAKIRKDYPDMSFTDAVKKAEKIYMPLNSFKAGLHAIEIGYYEE
jgi:uncharacterized NAD-dependent epimerase/dehydratase family protein